MKLGILVATLSLLLITAFAASGLSDSVYAQVGRTDAALVAILRLTDQLLPAVGNVNSISENIIADLQFKKKFYSFEDVVEGNHAFIIFVLDCGDVPDEACAFNVESIQLNGVNGTSGLPATVASIFVDDVFLDVSDEGIETPTNYLVDSGIGKLGASDFVAVTLDARIDGTFEFNGEKPQGISLAILPAEVLSAGISSAGADRCVPGADPETLRQCIKSQIEAVRNSQ